MTRKRESRPDFKTIDTGAELKRWYWLKSEFVDIARHHRLKTTGGKFQILDRIAHFLDTGETVFPGDVARKAKSTFDWHREPLSPQTVITDSYRNTQNVRRFFKSQVGESFRFNIEFMAWMKAHSGKTLEDAVRFYREMREREAQPGQQSVIADHNQFNQYTRDFLADNPQMGMKEVRHYWALKRQLPSENGRHVYERSDLELGT